MLKSAIAAQVSMTALGLPGVDQVHWTAPAFLIASAVFGFLSVVIACMQQQVIGMLNDPSRVRVWLSNGHFTDPERGQTRLQSSISALQLTRLPNTFLSYAVTSFLLGFGLYLGFAFAHDLDTTPGRNNNEAVLILFLAVSACGILETGGWMSWKLFEVSYAEQELGMDSAGRVHRAGDISNDADESRSVSGAGKDDASSKKLQDNVEEDASKASSSSGSQPALVAALEAAARAHEKCAEADREVALQYARLAQQ